MPQMSFIKNCIISKFPLFPVVEVRQDFGILEKGQTWKHKGCQFYFHGINVNAFPFVTCPPMTRSACYVYNGAVCCASHCPGILSTCPGRVSFSPEMVYINQAMVLIGCLRKLPKIIGLLDYAIRLSCVGFMRLLEQLCVGISQCLKQLWFGSEPR